VLAENGDTKKKKLSRACTQNQTTAKTTASTLNKKCLAWLKRD
jgi:hypothetical protein